MSYWDKFGGFSCSSAKFTSFCLCIHSLYSWTLPKRVIFVNPKICLLLILTYFILFYFYLLLFIYLLLIYRADFDCVYMGSFHFNFGPTLGPTFYNHMWELIPFFFIFNLHHPFQKSNLKSPFFSPFCRPLTTSIPSYSSYLLFFSFSFTFFLSIYSFYIF